MPEPVLVAIAAALAGKSVGTLYDLVKSKLSHRKEAAAALTAAAGTAPDSPEVHTLATHLAQATANDPTFARQLHATWAAIHTETGGVTNQITGTVEGNVIQARDIKGDITFN